MKVEKPAPQKLEAGLIKRRFQTKEEKRDYLKAIDDRRKLK